MKLYFMKQAAVNHLKANMKSYYINYYREKENQWIRDLFDYDPFELFVEVPDFKLATYTDKKGEMDMQNCKIMYQNLMHISESQASDERLWAGLCHSTFYEYCRMRWDYSSRKLKTPDKDAGTLLSRFFFVGGARGGFYRNTLAKYWWVGHATYQEHAVNHFEMLDALGSDDLASKITDLFFSNTFSSNPVITRGICMAWKMFNDRGIKLPVREYFRPALQYMNALGGGILLDVLSEEEIRDTFFEYISELYTNDKSSTTFVMDIGGEDDIDADLDDISNEEISDSIKAMQEQNTIKDKNIADLEKLDDKSDHITTIGSRDKIAEEEARKMNIFMGKPKEVVFGCVVIVSLKNSGNDRRYIIPKSDKEGTWFTIQRKLLGKKVGETFFLAGNTYTVKDISW